MWFEPKKRADHGFGPQNRADCGLGPQKHTVLIIALINLGHPGPQHARNNAVVQLLADSSLDVFGESHGAQHVDLLWMSSVSACMHVLNHAGEPRVAQVDQHADRNSVFLGPKAAISTVLRPKAVISALFGLKPHH